MSMTQEHKKRLYSLAEELSKLTEGDKQVLRILLFDKKDDCIHADRCKNFVCTAISLNTDYHTATVKHTKK